MTYIALRSCFFHPGSTSSGLRVFDIVYILALRDRYWVFPLASHPLPPNTSSTANTAMADSSGVAYHDLVSVPAPDTDTSSINNNPSTIATKTTTKDEAAPPLHEGPTASHALATSPTEETGLVQLGHNEEVRDLGWNEPKEAIPAPLVGGMENEDLWVLVRRFDKVRCIRLAWDAD